jgi:hypothetical protein
MDFISHVNLQKNYQGRKGCHGNNKEHPCDHSNLFFGYHDLKASDLNSPSRLSKELQQAFKETNLQQQ